MNTIQNISTVARREFTVRVRTRSFIVGTLLLVAGVVAIAFLPLIIRQIDDMDSTKVAVTSSELGLAEQAATTIGASLNATMSLANGGDEGDNPDYVLTAVADEDEGRTGVADGTWKALLVLERAPSGELEFVLYTKEIGTQATPTLVRQAANAFAIADRLDRLGIDAADQAALFAPASVEIRSPDPGDTDDPLDVQGAIGRDMLAFGMTILIFMIVIMYGNWVAMSVVEEKSSRVMEVILNAATPFQLLAGKVLGVGSVAFVQYAAVVAAGLLAIVLTDPISALVAGAGEAASLPEGLSPGLLLAFAAFGVLGFLLYASLYAAAGSLVSRQEDVNAAVMPLTLLSLVGYMVGVYASTGLIDPEQLWVRVLAILPFFSPFMMLGRMATESAQPWELVLALGLLALTIGAAIWVAARVYAAGVLLYGSRPGWRAVLRLLREGM